MDRLAVLRVFSALVAVCFASATVSVSASTNLPHESTGLFAFQDLGDFDGDGMQNFVDPDDDNDGVQDEDDPEPLNPNISDIAQLITPEIPTTAPTEPTLPPTATLPPATELPAGTEVPTSVGTEPVVEVPVDEAPVVTDPSVSEAEQASVQPPAPVVASLPDTGTGDSKSNFLIQTAAITVLIGAAAALWHAPVLRKK